MAAWEWKFLINIMGRVNEAIEKPVFNLVGVNHRTLPLPEREAFMRLYGDKRSLLSSLARHCRTTEVAVLSTCNRFEIISAGNEAEELIVDFLHRHLERPLTRQSLYCYRNGESARHFFRVAASLDSMVMGEAQILGQVKAAYLDSVQLGLAGKYLHHLFQYAFHVAKKIRSTTGIAEKGVSLSYIAVKLAEQIFGQLENRSVMVLGSGKMAELAVIHLKSYGCNEIIVANRTPDKAFDLARRFQGIAVPLDEASAYLKNVDVVIGSVNVAEPILCRAHLEKRRVKPIFFIDLGAPRNFSPDIGNADNAYLYNIDDLAAISSANLELREEAARDAEVLVEYGVRQFEKWVDKSYTQSKIVAFRSKVAVMCRAEIERSLHRSLRPEEASTLVPKLSHRISQKLLHYLMSDLEATIPEKE